MWCFGKESDEGFLSVNKNEKDDAERDFIWHLVFAHTLSVTATQECWAVVTRLRNCEGEFHLLITSKAKESFKISISFLLELLTLVISKGELWYLCNNNYVEMIWNKK